MIPNEEVRQILRSSVMTLLQQDLSSSDKAPVLRSFAVADGKALALGLTELLYQSISYYDYKEDFYHALIAGLWLGGGSTVTVKSNPEAGQGRPDVLVIDELNHNVLIIEIKLAADLDSLERRAQEGLEQIARDRYAFAFVKRYAVTCCALSFWKKECAAAFVRLNRQPGA